MVGPGPVPRVLGPGPGPWACVQGPGLWARALRLCLESCALAQGPKSEKCKMAKSTSEEKLQPRTFRMARIDPSRQGVMNERSFVHGDLYFCPKNVEKVQKRFQTTKNPIPPSIHPGSTAYFPLKGTIGPLTGIPLKGVHAVGPWARKPEKSAT